MIFVDDIIVISKTFNKHIQNLRKVFHKFKQANMSRNLNKCEFIKTSIHFLGPVSYTHLDVYKRQSYNTADNYVQEENPVCRAGGFGAGRDNRVSTAARQNLFNQRSRCYLQESTGAKYGCYRNTS